MKFQLRSDFSGIYFVINLLINPKMVHLFIFYFSDLLINLLEIGKIKTRDFSDRRPSGPIFWKIEKMASRELRSEKSGIFIFRFTDKFIGKWK